MRISDWSSDVCSSDLLFSLDSRAAPIAFDIHLEDGGVVHEAVDGGQRHCGIGEDPVPFAERLVGGYHQRTPLVSRADQLEQNRGFSLILGDRKSTRLNSSH